MPGGAIISKVGLNIISNGTLPVTQQQTFSGAGSRAFIGLVQVQEWSGLPGGNGGGKITSVALKFVSGTGNVRIKIYDDTGTSGQAGTLLGETGSIAVSTTGFVTFTLPSPVTIPNDGNVWVGQEEDNAGLTVESNISSSTNGVNTVYYVTHTFGIGPNPFGTAAGTNNPVTEQLTTVGPSNPHVRVKLYNDNGANAPNTLIAESASLAVGNNGLQNFTISGTVPSNGIIWAGVETDSITLTKQSQSAQAFNSLFVAHTFGSGPNPFGTGTTLAGFYEQLTFTDINHNIRVKLYNDNGANAPNTLIGESGSVSIAPGITGIQNFLISGTVPSNGIIWAGVETDSGQMTMVSQSAQAFNSLFVAHTFGSGPNPFGTGTTLAGFYEQLTYNLKPLLIQWDGVNLITTPSPITETSTGTFTGTFIVPASIGLTHTVTATEVGGLSATAIFTTPLAPTTFSLTGYILANNGVFNKPTITVPSNENVTALSLFNQGTGALISSANFNPPIKLTANVLTTIPSSLQDNSLPTGSQNYVEIATLQSGSTTITATSNVVNLNYGTVSTGNLNFNFTNTNVVPIYFKRVDLNTTDTRLSVIYPNTMSMLCNLNYTFAMTNKTYGPPLSSVPFDSSNSNSSFKFHNLQNEIVNVSCTDSISGSNAKYVLTQTSFPFQQQVQNLRNGTYGTHGQIGILDFVTIGIIIISMIGFNRVNETVGSIFSVAIIGAAAFFGFIQFPTFIVGAITIGVLIAILSTRKSGGF